MVRVFLHIGMHKTGSSAIQQALQGVSSSEYAYLNLGQPNHSIPIYTAFSQHYKNYHVWKRNGVPEQQIEQMREGFRAMLEQQISKPAAPHLVISGEDISYLTREEVAELAALMTGAGASVRVVAYFRNPVSYMSSSLQEVIKNGMRVNHNIELPRYRFRFEKFIQTFGRDSVDLRDYDRVRKDQKDVLADFCDSIGMPTPKRGAAGVNTSLSGTAVKALSLMNNADVLTLGDSTLSQARERLIDRLRAMFDDTFVLPDDIVLDALDGRDVDWLEKTAGVQFDIADLDRTSGPKGGYRARLQEFLSHLPKDACSKIAAELERDGVSAAAFSDPVALLTRLYYQELLAARL